MKDNSTPAPPTLTAALSPFHVSHSLIISQLSELGAWERLRPEYISSGQLRLALQDAEKLLADVQRLHGYIFEMVQDPKYWGK